MVMRSQNLANFEPLLRCSLDELFWFHRIDRRCNIIFVHQPALKCLCVTHIGQCYKRGQRFTAHVKMKYGWVQ